MISPSIIPQTGKQINRALASTHRKEVNPQVTQQIHIHDLYEGAFLLSMGHELTRITVRDQGNKRHCEFVFTGKGVESHARHFRSGRAMVNAAMLKFTLEKLKDRMFSSLRRAEKREQSARKGRKGRIHNGTHVQGPYQPH